MTEAFRRRIRAFLLAGALALSGGSAALAQSAPIVSQSFSMTARGNGPIIPLTGQSTCSIVLDNAGSGLTLVPQSTSALNPTPGSQWVTSSGVGGGSITTFGSYTGNVGGLGLTGFSFVITALSSGTVSGTETCSSAIGLVGVNITQVGGSPVVLGSANSINSIPVVIAADQSAIRTTTAYPYNGVNGQTLQSSSFIGAGGRDANGNFSPLSLDASQNLKVDVVAGGAGGGVVTQPTASLLNATVVGSVNQTAPTAGYSYVLDSAGVNVAGVDASHNQFMSVNAWGLGSTTTLGKVTTLLPYGASLVQTAVANSGLVAAGFDGTTVDALAVTTSGVLKTELCNPTGVGCSGVFQGIADGNNTATNAAVTTNFNQAFNGTSWDRVRSVNTGQLIVTPYDAAGNALLGSQTSARSIPAVIASDQAAIPTKSFYNAANTQTAVASSFYGIAGYDGTTVDALATTTNGVLKTQICSASGVTCAGATTPSSDGAGVAQGVATASQNLAFNGASWDRLRKDSYAAGPLWMTSGGSSAAVAIAAATAGPTVIKGSAGRLSRVLITTAGTTGTETFYDNASACSGTVIGIIPGTTALATAVAGAAPYLFDMFAANGITGCGGTGSPGVSVGYF